MIDFGGALVGCIVGLTLRGVERVVLENRSYSASSATSISLLGFGLSSNKDTLAHRTAEAFCVDLYLLQDPAKPS